MSARYHGHGADQAHVRLAEQLQPSAVVPQRIYVPTKVHLQLNKPLIQTSIPGGTADLYRSFTETAFSIVRGALPWHVPLRAICNEQRPSALPRQTHILIRVQ
jgi:hypothetical protein